MTVITSTCFGTGVPSSGILLSQRIMMLCDYTGDRVPTNLQTHHMLALRKKVA